MTKRFFSLILAAMLSLMLLIPAVTAEDQTIDTTAGHYYVYTENGKSLNVRFTPGGEKIGSLKYGARVYCYYLDTGNGWALIDYTFNHPTYGYGTYACYVSNRYLQKSKPAAKPDSSSSSSSSSSTSTDTLADLNKEFRSAKDVDPFAVTVRPSRASGWVNLRWAPSLSAEIIATYKQNDKLLVIKELKNWYQVEDQSTGNVGFISKKYVVK